jgi:plasmid stability protein
MRRVARVRTTLTIDEDLLKAVKVRAARTGRGDSEVIEEAVRRELGHDVFDELWAKNDMPEDEAMELALEAQRWARQQRRRAR